jgi:phenylacetate-CoA ligase
MLDSFRDLWLTARGVMYASKDGRRAETWSLDQRSAFQVRQLKKVLSFAARNVPHYTQLFMKLGFDPEAIQSVQDLQRLPILEKKLVFAEPERFCSYESLRHSVKLRTSGTTGQPMQCYTDESQWVIEQGAIWRQWHWAGYRFRDKIAMVRSYRPAVGQPPMRMDRLRNWLYLSPYHLDPDTLRQYLLYLQKWRPAFLRGYPNSLALLAQFAREEGLQLPSLKAALTASETLTPMHRAAVRDAFGIEIFDHYGQAEISCMLHECERHDGMHVLDDYAVVELVPTSEPRRFRLIATNLQNTAMPLIRYDTGDIVRGPLRTCKCGRSFPVVDAIEGRADENLRHARGYEIPTVNIHTFMSKQDNVRRFQVIQETDGRIRVILDIRSAALPTAELIGDYFRGATGQPVEIDTSGQFVQTGEGKSPTILKGKAR